MYYYECPYCKPSTKNKLVYSRMHGESSKPIFKCKMCDSEFVLNEDFKSTQKRKIKDG